MNRTIFGVFFALALVGSLAGLRAQVATDTPSSGTNDISAEPTPIPREIRKAKAESAEKSETTTTTTASKSSSDDDAVRERVKQLMGAENFYGAGLDKLSIEELRKLESSLKGYRKAVETKATEKATAEAERKVKAEAPKRFDRIESRVDGSITRLTGHSIIRLEDGTMWKQAVSEDRYPAQVTERPSATVFRTGFGYKMRIAGLPEIYVDPYIPK